MVTRTASSARSIAARHSAITHLQQRLAFRLLLLCLVPLAIIAVLGVYAYRLSGRVQEIEVLERVSYVDRIYRETHNVPWAVAEYKALSGRYPGNPRIFVRLGALYHEDSQDDRAVELLRKAIALKADDWEAFSTLAYIELSRQNDAAAIAAGEMAIRHSHTDVQAYNNLAWIYATTHDERLRDLAKAVPYAEKAVTLTRCRQKDYLDTLAEVYRRSGRAQEASEITRAGASALVLCAPAAVASATTGGR
jgi:tetratricopeptide (TPR) repeat protein